MRPNVPGEQEMGLSWVSAVTVKSHLDGSGAPRVNNKPLPVTFTSAVSEPSLILQYPVLLTPICLISETSE